MIEKDANISAVYIDVDLTLLSCASFRTFILSQYRGSGFSNILNLICSYFLRKLRLYDVLQFKQQCLSIFKGMNRSNLEIIGYQFSQNVLLKNVRPGALECLKKYKNKGVPIYLASASPSFYIKALADQLQLSGFLATELKYDSNLKYTGEFLGGDCIGMEKAKRIIKYSERIGIDLESSFFYTDSYEDLPSLKSVGIPIAVWPDNRLKKICRQKGWEIQNW